MEHQDAEVGLRGECSLQGGLKEVTLGERRLKRKMLRLESNV